MRGFILSAVLSLSLWPGSCSAIIVINSAAPTLKTLLVQTNFPSEETMNFSTPQHAISYALQEWQEIFGLLQPSWESQFGWSSCRKGLYHKGIYWPVYHHEAVIAGWREHLSEQALPRSD